MNLPHWRHRLRQIGQLALLATLVALPGCSGCLQTDESQQAAEERKKKEKPKPDFEPPKLAIEPNENSTPPKRGVKPGHWTSATLEMKANNFDFHGQLDSTVCDIKGNPLNLDRNRFWLASERAAQLAKGQPKRLELTFFVPTAERTNTWLSNRLRTHGGGEVLGNMDPLELMPPYQFYFVVLSDSADSYGILEQLDSVHPLDDEITQKPLQAYYRIINPRIDRSAPLPAHPLTWSSIAYVLWDDLPPTVLNNDQQQAMLDWLHWGGQLIISGPDTLESLKNSFLSPYLPATAEETIKITTSDLEDLNRWWTLPEKNKPGPPLEAVIAWSGIKLAKHPEAEYVGKTGQLLVERDVGRGRIVVTAFRLMERDLRTWHGFDGFVNGCLLRRPPRVFKEDNLVVKVDWADDKLKELDPTLISTVRYLSRDIPLVIDPDALEKERAAEMAAAAAAKAAAETQGLPYTPALDEWANLLETPARPEGPDVAQWSDFNELSNIARYSLQQAAGIEIPRSSFVLAVLAAYLVVLVPLNWGLFQMIGRVEWAWVAAPIVSIICAGSVIKLAELDIGFARSQREIAIVESFAGYPRAHVTRYTALYSSLSTTQDLSFDDPSAVALPFSADPNYQLLRGQSRTEVTYHLGDPIELTGFEVASNSTGMVHSEQLFNLDGKITVSRANDGTWKVFNSTPFSLAGGGVVRQTIDGPELGWFKELPAGGSQTIELQKEPLSQPDEKPQAESTDTWAKWSEHLNLTAASRPEVQGLDRLVRLLQDPARLKPGEQRLIAWTNEGIPGQTIEPSAAQSRFATLFVVHLQPATRGDPQPDKNTRYDFTSFNASPHYDEAPSEVDKNPKP